MEKSERGHWHGSINFIISLLGYAIGLGNLWRFSYLCHKHGGAAFLIPYLLGATFISVPLIMFEIGIGQLMQKSRVHVWNRMPIMKGIGYASVVIGIFSNVAFITIMAWTLVYLFYSVKSFGQDLPWDSCDNPWNSDYCLVLSATLKNQTLRNETTAILNSDHLSTIEFWNNFILRHLDGAYNGNQYNWPIFGTSLISASVVTLINIKGISSSQMVMYVTAVLPYFTMFSLFIRGITLEGAWIGVQEYLYIDFDVLRTPQVWVDGASQAMYTFGVCFLALTTFGSYNKKNNDFFKNTIFVVPVGVCTSIIMGFMTYSILGHMSHVTGVDVKDVVAQGPGLVFKIIPTAIALMPLPWIWSILFFVTLYLLAIDTIFAECEGLASVVIDHWPRFFTTSNRKSAVHISVGLFTLLLSLPHTLKSGIYIFELVNNFGMSGICLLWVAFFESMSIGWFYDSAVFRKAVSENTGRTLPRWILMCYKYLIPPITLAIFISYCVAWKPLTIGDYVYPAWATTIGWLLSLASITTIPIFIGRFMFTSKGSFIERIKSGLYQSEGPPDHEDVVDAYEIKSLRGDII